jgi:hypothetical protein
MSDFTLNERIGYYEAMDGGHSIYIDADVLMTELQALQESKGLSEAEARDEVFDIGWWMNRFPQPGLFIDGIEQVDDGDEIHDLLHVERTNLKDE